MNTQIFTSDDDSNHTGMDLRLTDSDRGILKKVLDTLLNHSAVYADATLVEFKQGGSDPKRLSGKPRAEKIGRIFH